MFVSSEDIQMWEGRLKLQAFHAWNSYRLEEGRGGSLLMLMSSYGESYESYFNSRFKVK